MPKKIIDVTAAVLEEQDCLLLAQRKPGSHLAGYWEFPGGKIEANESPRECLKRELLEELGYECEVNDFICMTEYDYGDRIIRLHTYRARRIRGELNLTAHSKIAWVPLHQLPDYQMPPADVPILEALKVAHAHRKAHNN